MRVKLEEVCKRIYAGGDVPKDRYSEVKTKEYPIPIYANAEKDNGLYGYTDKAREEELSITVAARGTIGFTAIRREPFLPVVRLITVVPDTEKVSERYLYYVLKNCKPQSSGTSIPQLTVPDIKKNRLELYDISEQERIADQLDKLSKVIELRKQELDALDSLIKARFVELFGLPVSNTKGWKTEQMGEVAPAVNYKGEFDDEVWLLNLDMVEAQTGRILDYLVVSEEEVGNSTCTFDTSNVLYSKLRPYLNKVVIPDRCGYATSELVPLQPVKTKINREYFAFMLRSDEFVNMINEKVAGAKMPRVPMGDFRKFDVPVPPMELQEQFADLVHQVDKSKVAVQKALDETQILFDSLMQEYFG